MVKFSTEAPRSLVRRGAFLTKKLDKTYKMGYNIFNFSKAPGLKGDNDVHHHRFV